MRSPRRRDGSSASFVTNLGLISVIHHMATLDTLIIIVVQITEYCVDLVDQQGDFV